MAESTLPLSLPAGAASARAHADSEPRRLRRLALFAVGFAGVVVVLGAWTRLSDAGLGCPDWPGCYGFLAVPQSEAAQALAASRFPDAPVEAAKAWWEMIHRYFAGTLGLLILGLSALAFRARRRWRQYPDRHQRLPLGLPLLLLALVICQGAFGAWTVTLKLWPQVVTAHLLGGFATLSLLWLLSLRLGVAGEVRLPAAVRGHAALALVLVVAQIALGGWVSSNYAALACSDFPTCHGAWIPTMDLGAGFDFAQQVGPNYLGGQLDSEARVAIHFAHRVGGLLVALVVGALAWRLWRAGSAVGLALFGVLGLQLLLGVANILLLLPLWNATLHNAVGALLLLCLVLVNYRARSHGTPSY